ncbi:DUF397 domain-containing protein [Streptomyces sp. NBC_01267]|uniref:DUF397 domain-containing protein n=1 Tax=unclassified Streptomyces TaxID=2593676 RepID=UPI002DD8B280|nr:MULTISPECIES: DUF397 domain-containing protein [unclassified Streptomyces]WSC20189.1 DUF397 domain-containing protein [Streptomyces sp. NBC_01766]WSV54206.1 DUF397 domain-containing protein [Streptomyces sp. NBC_01014]
MPIADWQKSSYCAEGSNCVELAAAPGGALYLRESDDPDRVITVGRAGLAAFLAARSRFGAA